MRTTESGDDQTEKPGADNVEQDAAHCLHRGVSLHPWRIQRGDLLLARRACVNDDRDPPLNRPRAVGQFEIDEPSAGLGHIEPSFEPASIQLAQRRIKSLPGSPGCESPGTRPDGIVARQDLPYQMDRRPASHGHQSDLPHILALPGIMREGRCLRQRQGSEDHQRRSGLHDGDTGAVKIVIEDAILDGARRAVTR